MGGPLNSNKTSFILGRAADNDIRFSDTKVSRKHLKVEMRKNRYFLTDLGSRNGTFHNGNYLKPGVEVEAKLGIPIAMGWTVLCIGEEGVKHMPPFLDLIILNRITGQDGLWDDWNGKTRQEILELLYSVSGVLAENMPIGEGAQEMLDRVFDHLKKIDGAVFFLFDPETGEITEMFSKSKKPDAGFITSFCREVLNKVMEDRRPLVALDAHAEEDNDLADTLKTFRIESVVCVPLVSESRILGALYFDSLVNPNSEAKDDLRHLMVLPRRDALSVAYTRLAHKLSDMANQLPHSKQFSQD